MASTPLLVAGVAAALLVVTLGVDAGMTTTYALDVWTGSTWRELARMPQTYDGRSSASFGQTTIAANESDDVRLRLRVDNGNFWASAQSFTVLHAGEPVAGGTIEAARRAEAVSEFTVPAERFFGGLSGSERSPPVPQGAAAGPFYAELYVEVERVSLYASFNVREVSA